MGIAACCTNMGLVEESFQEANQIQQVNKILTLFY